MRAEAGTHEQRSADLERRSAHASERWEAPEGAHIPEQELRNWFDHKTKNWESDLEQLGRTLHPGRHRFRPALEALHRLGQLHGDRIEERRQRADVGLDPLGAADGSDLRHVRREGKRCEVGDGEFGHPHGIREAALVLGGGHRVVRPPRGHGDPDLPCQFPVDGTRRGQEDSLDLTKQRHVTEDIAEWDFRWFVGLMFHAIHSR